jgi:aminoglycoside phosphotransferase (APT) family kinase protein
VYLTAGSVVPYLLQKGILSAPSLLEDDWHALQSDATRPVLRITGSASPGWIVKQASPLDRNQVEMLDREAAIFQLAAEVGWARPLRKLLPEFRSYDPGVHALIVALVPHDTGLDHLRRSNAQPQVFGNLLGRALATVHVPLDQRGPSSAMLSKRMPWILQFDAADHEAMPAGAERRLVELVKREAGLSAALTRLGHDWRNATLVHGDAKLDNVLVRIGPRPRVWLVDWAFTGIGDPAWDVGTIVHSALMLWLHGIPFQREQPFTDALDEATLPLAATRDFIRTFTSAYCDARRLRNSAGRSFARRAFSYAGAAMVQSAIAAANLNDDLTPRQLAVIQTASHILDDPDDTLREFLDIE